MARGGKIGYADKESGGTTLTSAEHPNKGASQKRALAEVCLEAPAVLLKSHIDQQTSPEQLLPEINITSKQDDRNSPTSGTGRH